MAKEEKYTGCGIYGLYNAVENKIYIGQSSNIRARFTQHRSNFKAKSNINPMYQEPIENFVFLVLYKMSDEDFEKYNRMFEDLFIASAERNRMGLYNRNKTYGDATASVLWAFGIYDNIENSIYEKIGCMPWMLKMMKRENKIKALERAKEGC